MRISDWSSDVCSSDLRWIGLDAGEGLVEGRGGDTGRKGFSAELLAPLAEAQVSGFRTDIGDGGVARLAGGGDVADQSGLREGFGCTGNDQAHRRSGNQGT